MRSQHSLRYLYQEGVLDTGCCTFIKPSWANSHPTSHHCYSGNHTSTVPSNHLQLRAPRVHSELEVGLDAPRTWNSARQSLELSSLIPYGHLFNTSFIYIYIYIYIYCIHVFINSLTMILWPMSCFISLCTSAALKKRTALNCIS